MHTLKATQSLDKHTDIDTDTATTAATTAITDDEIEGVNILRC